jgi:hypothetical protein
MDQACLALTTKEGRSDPARAFMQELEAERKDDDEVSDGVSGSTGKPGPWRPCRPA